MEYALHEIGMGGCAAVHKYWVQGVQDYALRLDQEDLEMIQEYKSLAVSIHLLCIWSSENSVFVSHVFR